MLAGGGKFTGSLLEEWFAYVIVSAIEGKESGALERRYRKRMAEQFAALLRIAGLVRVAELARIVRRIGWIATRIGLLPRNFQLGGRRLIEQPIKPDGSEAD